MTRGQMIEEVAHQMALLPIATLGGLRLARKPREGAWWLIALAFGVSWMADTVAEQMAPRDRWAVTLIYPIIQTTLIASVFLPRRWTLWLMLMLVILASQVILWLGVVKPDVFLHSAASLAVIAVVQDKWEMPARLRLALLVYFGLGWIAWLVHEQALVVGTWYGYQAMRLVGLLLFCWAVVTTPPHVRVLPRQSFG